MPAFFLVIMDFLKKYWQYILVAIVLIWVWRKLFIGTTTVNHNYATGGSETFTKADAKALADRLYLAMDGFGTDNDVVQSVFYEASRNLDNLRMIYNAFGNHDYGTFGSPSWFNSGTPTDLKGWLYNELSPDVYNSWLALFNLAGIK